MFKKKKVYDERFKAFSPSLQLKILALEQKADKLKKLCSGIENDDRYTQGVIDLWCALIGQPVYKINTIASELIKKYEETTNVKKLQKTLHN